MRLTTLEGKTIKAKPSSSPSFTSHGGRTWDSDRKLINGEFVEFWFDSTWGKNYYFKYGAGWYSVPYVEAEPHSAFQAETSKVTPMPDAYTLETFRVRVTVKDPIGKASDPYQARDIARATFNTLDADQEHFVVFGLDVKTAIRGFKVIASGGQDQVDIDMKVVFRNILLMGAHSVIIAHNHPSGDPSPSHEDDRLTREFIKGADLLGIRFLDHIILGDNTDKFYSYQAMNPSLLMR